MSILTVGFMLYFLSPWMTSMSLKVILYQPGGTCFPSLSIWSQVKTKPNSCPGVNTTDLLPESDVLYHTLSGVEVICISGGYGLNVIVSVDVLLNDNLTSIISPGR